MPGVQSQVLVASTARVVSQTLIFCFLCTFPTHSLPQNPDIFWSCLSSLPSTCKVRGIIIRLMWMATRAICLFLKTKLEDVFNKKINHIIASNRIHVETCTAHVRKFSYKTHLIRSLFSKIPRPWHLLLLFMGALSATPVQLRLKRFCFWYF